MKRCGRAVVVTLVGTCVLFLAAIFAASCGGPARPPSSPPMEGSASIQPSPARAERVPVEPTASTAPAPSSSK
ncbi:MAG: hypothetical protein ACHREM_15925 [Polyangiales bacterium]